MLVGKVVMIVKSDEACYKDAIGEIGYISQSYDSIVHAEGVEINDVVMGENKNYHCMYDFELFVIGDLE